jgi:hypothetical protein
MQDSDKGGWNKTVKNRHPGHLQQEPAIQRGQKEKEDGAFESIFRVF